MPHVAYQAQSKKHMLILAFDPIAETATSPVFAARKYEICVRAIRSLGCLPADQRPLHATNKGSPMVITAELVAQLRAHPYRQSRIFF
jgi:hypothetical protein